MKHLRGIMHLMFALVSKCIHGQFSTILNQVDFKTKKLLFATLFSEMVFFI